MKTTKLIAVVYDNAEGRQTAIGFCDGLVSRFWDQFEFDLSWWPFDQLEAEQASRKAAVADIVVFATDCCQRIPARFTEWIEVWLRAREEHEGMLVHLLSSRASSELGASAMSVYLRSVAHRAGMDYLTGMPESLFHPIPESLDSCAKRAQQVTSLLDGILHSPLPAAPVPLG